MNASKHKMLRMRQRLPLAVFIIAIVLIAGAYVPGLGGTFWLDDFQNIVLQKGLQIEAVSLDGLSRAVNEATTGGLNRPIAVASFAVDHAIGGMYARQFLVSNLLIHLIATLAVLCFVRVLARQGGQASWWPAIIAAALWAAHPINLTGVLYIVQRMTSLSALFSLCAIALYLHMRLQRDYGLFRAVAMAALIGLAGLCALLSKENAVLIPLLLTCAEITVLKSKRGAPGEARFVAIVCYLPSILVLSALVYSVPSFVGDFQARAFDMPERLMTEARVLWFYVGLIFIPNLNAMSLFHDGIAVSKSLTQPLSTTLAIAAWVTVIVAAIRWRSRAPYLVFGALFFLVGHLIESTIVPLELVFEHRNYLPSAGLIAGVVLQVSQWLSTHEKRSSRVAIFGAGVLFVALLSVTHIRAQIWGTPGYLLERAVQLQPESPRAAAMLASRYANRCRIDDPTTNPQCIRAVEWYRKSSELNPDNAGSLISLAGMNYGLTGQLDPDMVEEIDIRLKDRAVPWVNVNALLTQLIESGEGRPALPSVVLANWTESLLTNSGLPKNGRVAILVEYSRLLNNQMRQPGYAEDILRSAVELDPNHFATRLQFVKLLVANGQEQEARAQWKLLSEMPVFHSYRDSLVELTHQLRTN